jgi:hypothetical protein
MHPYRHGSRLTMMRRSKEAGGPPQRPDPTWLAGAFIGLGIATLATNAIMLGAGLAVGQAVTRGK